MAGWDYSVVGQSVILGHARHDWLGCRFFALHYLDFSDTIYTHALGVSTVCAQFTRNMANTRTQ